MSELDGNLNSPDYEIEIIANLEFGTRSKPNSVGKRLLQMAKMSPSLGNINLYADKDRRLDLYTLLIHCPRSIERGCDVIYFASEPEVEWLLTLTPERRREAMHELLKGLRALAEKLKEIREKSTGPKKPQLIFVGPWQYRGEGERGVVKWILSGILDAVCRKNPEVMSHYSLSKHFGMYNEFSRYPAKQYKASHLTRGGIVRVCSGLFTCFCALITERPANAPLSEVQIGLDKPFEIDNPKSRITRRNYQYGEFIRRIKDQEEMERLRAEKARSEAELNKEGSSNPRIRAWLEKRQSHLGVIPE